MMATAWNRQLTTTLNNLQIANPPVAALYEDALVYETGSAITSTGALSAYSGAKTGRSPSDKRIVKEETSDKDVWWGPVNKPMTVEVRTTFLRVSNPLCVRWVLQFSVLASSIIITLHRLAERDLVDRLCMSSVHSVSRSQTVRARLGATTPTLFGG